MPWFSHYLRLDVSLIYGASWYVYYYCSLYNVTNIYCINHIFFKLIILGLLAQWYSIDIFSPTAQFSFKTVSVHISALVETVLSAVIALLVSQPVGSLSLKSCAVVQVFNHKNVTFCKGNNSKVFFSSLIGIHYFTIQILIMRRLSTVRKRQCIHCKSLYFLHFKNIIKVTITDLFYNL